MKKSWLFWGLGALAVYYFTKSTQASPFVGPINQPGYYPFVGPINQPASEGGAAANHPAVIPGTLDVQTQLWDPCYSGSLVFDPQACVQSGRTTY